MNEKITAMTPFDRYQNVRFFGSLNGLRFLCIIAVMWHHAPLRSAMDDPSLILLRGFVGVDFFFVLSGYLITTLLLREETRRGRFSLTQFYRRRFLRIVPVYFLIVTALSFYFVVIKGQTALLPLVPYYYLFLSNMLISDIPMLTITWSLAVEEQYYLVWPLLMLLLPTVVRFRVGVLIGLLAICIATEVGLAATVGLRPIVTEHAIWQLTAGGFQAILLGTLGAVLLDDRYSFNLIYRFTGFRGAPLAFFCILGLELNGLLPGVLTGWPNLIMHSTMLLCLLSIVVREDHVLAKVFSWRPIARIGEISYGIYLYHLIALHVTWLIVQELGLASWLDPIVVTIGLLPVSVVMAEISFRTFEAYFLRKK